MFANTKAFSGFAVGPGLRPAATVTSGQPRRCDGAVVRTTTM